MFIYCLSAKPTPKQVVILFWYSISTLYISAMRYVMNQITVVLFQTGSEVRCGAFFFAPLTRVNDYHITTSAIVQQTFT